MKYSRLMLSAAFLAISSISIGHCTDTYEEEMRRMLATTNDTFSFSYEVENGTVKSVQLNLGDKSYPLENINGKFTSTFSTSKANYSAEIEASGCNYFLEVEDKLPIAKQRVFDFFNFDITDFWYQGKIHPSLKMRLGLTFDSEPEYWDAIYENKEEIARSLISNTPCIQQSGDFDSCGNNVQFNPLTYFTQMDYIDSVILLDGRISRLGNISMHNLLDNLYSDFRTRISAGNKAITLEPVKNAVLRFEKKGSVVAKIIKLEALQSGRLGFEQNDEEADRVREELFNPSVSYGQ